MKVTSNLSFLLCISSVVMPAIDARASGLSFKRSAAMKPSIKGQEVSRSLQTEDELALQLCEAFLEILLGPNSGCKCAEDGELTSDCEDFLSQCDICDTIQGERICLAFAEEESSAASTADILADCYTYESGPFDNTICTLDNFVESTCTITIDGTECNSCAIVACSATDGTGVFEESYDFDCSNVIEGEAWNLCTADIPETSRFLASGNNDLFTDMDCGSGNSGGFALSFRVLSVLVSLVVVATFL
jgi:hypothetical protein